MGKLRRVMQKWLDSITTKIAVIIVLSILPLNALVIFATAQAIDVVQRQALASLESVAGLYMQRLDSSAFSASYYLYDLEENNADFIRLTMQQGDDAYNLAKSNIARHFATSIETADTADAYFCFASDLDDGFLVLPQGVLQSGGNIDQARADVLAFLSESDLASFKRWNLVSLPSQDWLMRIYSNGTFYCGALLSVDNVRADIMQAVEFPSLRICANTQAASVPETGELSVVSNSARTPLILHLYVPRSGVLRTLPFLQWMALVLAFAYLALIPLLIVALNRLLIKPLNKIQSALQRLRSGERDYRISFHRYSEEFRSINQSFNDMADSIERLKIENYENELERQRMEIRNLQLQIRPHFLLNTFNLVYSLAEIKEYQSIQKLALYLSDYFRYIFRSGRDLEPFEQEYSLIREYLSVSALRYPEGFTVSYDIPDDMLRIDVPPLLVHNFVQNIIQHALLPDRVVHIGLCARRTDGFAEFTITDDGVGMDAETVESINRNVFINASNERIHVGIENSFHRLRCFYGEKSKLHVESTPETGTRFLIRFPIRQEEEKP